jgi:hypothetical protein
LAPARILTFAELADGLVLPCLQWGELWEDIVGRPNEHIPGDEALRGQNRLWLRSLDLTNPDHLRFMLYEGTKAEDILCHCTVRHEREILEQYGGLYASIAEYEAAEGPHAYWYNCLRVPELLRFADAPVPGAPPPKPKRLEGGAPRAADLFAGIGNVSVGLSWAGFEVGAATAQETCGFPVFSAAPAHMAADMASHALW